MGFFGQSYLIITAIFKINIIFNTNNLTNLLNGFIINLILKVIN